jgi:hypothetical protein
MCALSLAWSLRQKLFVARRGVLATLPAQSGACIHNWTSREPVFAAEEGDMLAHPLNKGGPDGTGLALSKLGIEICWGSPFSRQMKEM